MEAGFTGPLDVKLWQGSVLRLSQWLSLNWGQDSVPWVPEVGVLNCPWHCNGGSHVP